MHQKNEQLEAEVSRQIKENKNIQVLVIIYIVSFNFSMFTPMV